MPVPASINDLSTTPGSNSPAGSESPALIDDYLRFQASCIALLRDSTAGAIVRTGATGSAVMPVGTTAQRDGTPVAGYMRGNSTLLQPEYYNGAEWVQQGWQSTVVDNGGVNAIDMTGIPAWAKEIVIGFDGVSLNADREIEVQLGTGAGIQTTGYNCVGYRMGGTISGEREITTGWQTTSSAATLVRSGFLRLFLINPNTNTWSGDANWTRSGTFLSDISYGTKSLPARLTQIRVYGLSSALFDAGSVSLSWRI